MGMLFTTEGTRRIVDTLNTAFSEKGVAQMVKDETANPWLTSNKAWRLARACAVYGIYPVNQDTDPLHHGELLPGHKRRWNFFLEDNLFKKNKTTHDAIRDAIRDGLNNNSTITRFSFDHVETAPGANVSVVIFDAPIPGKTTKVRHITLLTPALDSTNPGSDPGNPDPGEPSPRPFPG